jgi:hypothetical protein
MMISILQNSGNWKLQSWFVGGHHHHTSTIYYN